MLNHLGSRSARLHFSGTETCSSPRAFTQIAQQATSSKGCRCVHKATMPRHQKLIPLPNPNAAPLPRPVLWGEEEARGRAPIPPEHPQLGREVHSDLPCAQTSPPTRRYVQAKIEGASPERQRQNGFTCFLLSPLHNPHRPYLYCYTELKKRKKYNYGSLKAKSISKWNEHLSILAKHLTGPSCSI